MKDEKCLVYSVTVTVIVPSANSAVSWSPL